MADARADAGGRPDEGAGGSSVTGCNESNSSFVNPAGIGALGGSSSGSHRTARQQQPIRKTTILPESPKPGYNRATTTVSASSDSKIAMLANPWGVPNGELREHFATATDTPTAPTRLSVAAMRIAHIKPPSKYMIDRNSSLLQLWHCVIIAWGVFSVVWAPFSMLLRSSVFVGAWPLTVRVCDVLLHVSTVFYCLDVLVQMNTSAFGPYGSIRRDREEVIRSYASNFLVLDLVSALPIYQFLHWAGSPGATMSMSLIIMRMVRIERLLLTLYMPVVLRLVNIVGIFTILAHWSAIVFVYAAMATASGGWIAVQGIVPSAETYSEVYVTALYFAITMMTTVGFGDVTPSTVFEREVGIVLLIIGSVFYAFVFGMVFEIVKKLLVSQILLEAKLENASSFISHYQIEGPLKTKILKYTRTLAQAGGDIDVSGLGLPEHVSTEVQVHIHANLIKDVPLFENASFNFIRALVLRMTPEVVVQYDHIMVMEDLSDCMYFVSKGTLVVSLKTGMIVAALQAGSYFGEIALLTRQPRTVNVWAVETSTVLKLTSNAFDEVSSNFPEYVKAISDKAYARISQLRSKAKDPEEVAEQERLVQAAIRVEQRSHVPAPVSRAVELAGTAVNSAVTRAKSGARLSTGGLPVSGPLKRISRAVTSGGGSRGSRASAADAVSPQRSRSCAEGLLRSSKPDDAAGEAGATGEDGAAGVAAAERPNGGGTASAPGDAVMPVSSDEVGDGRGPAQPKRAAGGVTFAAEGDGEEGGGERSATVHPTLLVEEGSDAAGPSVSDADAGALRRQLASSLLGGGGGGVGAEGATLLSEHAAIEQTRAAIMHALRVRTNDLIDLQDAYDTLCEQLAAEATLHLLTNGNSLVRTAAVPVTPPVSRSTSSAAHPSPGLSRRAGGTSPGRTSGSASRRSKFKRDHTSDLSNSMADDVERREAEHRTNLMAADVARMRLLKEVKDIAAEAEAGAGGESGVAADAGGDRMRLSAASGSAVSSARNSRIDSEDGNPGPSDSADLSRHSGGAARLSAAIT